MIFYKSTLCKMSVGLEMFLIYFDIFITETISISKIWSQSYVLEELSNTYYVNYQSKFDLKFTSFPRNTISVRFIFTNYYHLSNKRAASLIDFEKFAPPARLNFSLLVYWNLIFCPPCSFIPLPFPFFLHKQPFFLYLLVNSLPKLYPEGT